MAAEGAANPAARTCAAAAAAGWCQQFGYDGRGNRAVAARAHLTPSLTGEPAVFDARNRMADLDAAGAPVWAYDGRGNVARNALGERFRYDADGRLRGACPSQQTTTCYSQAGGGRTLHGYDGAGRRVRTDADGVTVVYVYDAFGQLAAEYTTAAAVPGSGTLYVAADHLGSARVATSIGRMVVERRDYLPFGEELLAGAGSARAAVAGYGRQAGVRLRFTGKERDEGTGLDYFGARYYSGAQGRFTSPDPTFLNILRVVSPQRWNQYAYAINNPLKYIDPDGLEAVAINYPGYQVGVRGNFALPLGHAGVVMVRKDGSTHYFEYGRYNGPVGEVRNAGKDNVPTPAVQRDASGKITPASMKQLLSTLSQAAGKDGQVDALVFQAADIEDMVMEAYLAARQRENTDPQRRHYSLFGGHNCGTLICETFDAAGHPSPYFRSGYMPSDIFDQLRWHFGPSQQFEYTPKTEKFTSKICFNAGNGKKVCQ